jgi:hypothetical protein
MLLADANGTTTGQCNAGKVSSSRTSSTLATSKSSSTTVKSSSSSSSSPSSSVSSSVSVSVSSSDASSSLVTSSPTPSPSASGTSSLSPSTVASSSIVSVSASPLPPPPVCANSDGCNLYTGDIQDSCPNFRGSCTSSYSFRCTTLYPSYVDDYNYVTDDRQDCLDSCTAKAGCPGVVYSIAEKICHVLKSLNLRQNAYYQPNIDTYVKLCDKPTISSTPIELSASSTVAHLSSTSGTPSSSPVESSSPIASTTASPTPSFCPALDNTCASGYRVRCGISPNNFEVDETPGGITEGEGVTVQTCLDACTARPHCVAAYNDEAGMGCILLTALELDDNPTLQTGFDTYLKGCEDTPSLPSTPVEMPISHIPSASASPSPTPAMPSCRYLDLESMNQRCPAFDGPLADACPSEELRCKSDYQINCGQVPGPGSRPLFMNNPKSTAEDCFRSCNIDDRCVAAVYTQKVGICDGYGEVAPLQASGDDRRTTFLRVCARQR